jgi:predicted transposase YdaD
VPILDDILDHEVLGREYKRGKQEGEQEGRQEGRRQGRQEGELRLLRRLIEKRFGPLPPWAEERLRSCSVQELERTGERFVDAASLDELLR